MKAHRFKMALTSREEIARRFHEQLKDRLSERVDQEVGGQGILVRSQFYSTPMYSLIHIQEKRKLLEDWEREGRNIAFSDEKPGELIYKEYELKMKHKL